MQNIISSENYAELDEFFSKSGAKSILLVYDSSLKFLRIKDYFDIFKKRMGIKMTKFSDFQPNYCCKGIPRL